MTLRAGDELAPGYEVVEHLAHGQALDVYDVWSAERGCLCVAKTLRPDHRSDPADRRRLRNEGRLLLSLTHPHIVRAYELIERPHPVLVLETLSGSTLGHLIESSKRRLRVADLVHLGLQLSSALGYLHANGYLHLDLKPSNVIAENGRARMIDLSVARRPGRGPRGLGTRQYMAPEQARGGRFSEATDVWGLGATLYEAATGERPFAPRDRRVEYPQLNGGPPHVGERRRLPAPLGRTIDACLEPDPADRPALGEVEDALDESL